MLFKGFILLFLIPLVYGEDCFNACSSFSSSPSTNPFPSGFQCSFNQANYTSRAVAYESPPASYVWTYLGSCEQSEEEEETELSELMEYQIAIQSLLIGVILGSCFVGIIRYAL